MSLKNKYSLPIPNNTRAMPKFIPKKSFIRPEIDNKNTSILSSFMPNTEKKEEEKIIEEERRRIEEERRRIEEERRRIEEEKRIEEERRRIEEEKRIEEERRRIEEERRRIEEEKRIEEERRRIEEERIKFKRGFNSSNELIFEENDENEEEGNEDEDEENDEDNEDDEDEEEDNEDEDNEDEEEDNEEEDNEDEDEDEDNEDEDEEDEEEEEEEDNEDEDEEEDNEDEDEEEDNEDEEPEEIERRQNMLGSEEESSKNFSKIMSNLDKFKASGVVPIKQQRKTVNSRNTLIFGKKYKNILEVFHNSYYSNVYSEKIESIKEIKLRNTIQKFISEQSNLEDPLPQSLAYLIIKKMKYNCTYDEEIEYVVNSLLDSIMITY